MSHVSFARLFRMKKQKLNKIFELTITKRRLQEKLDYVMREIEVQKSHISTINREMNNKCIPCTPKIEIIQLGKLGKNMVYGAKINFEGIEGDFFKIIDCDFLIGNNMLNDNILFNEMAIEYVTEWLQSTHNLSDHLNLNSSQKELLQISLRTMERQNEKNANEILERIPVQLD
jgi:hypothetical protein